MELEITFTVPLSMFDKQNVEIKVRFQIIFICAENIYVFVYLYNTTYSAESRGLISSKKLFCEINNYTIYLFCTMLFQ